jgi:ribosomal protein S18 acetylase RimI-like enzyme
MPTNTIIRAFDGTLADAEGLLAVERATFDESPYNAEQVQAMLTDGEQRAWLAVNEGQVIGFAAVFPTWGLQGPRWEIDLLAVLQEWTGHGLGTALIQAAATHGIEVARRARAVVAADNAASARAFARAGFRRAKACTLLIRRIQGLSPHPWTTLGLTVHEAGSVEEAAPWLPEGVSPVTPGESVPRPQLGGLGGLGLLLAESRGRSAGYAELLEVQTLLYRGVWIESLVASERQAAGALVHEVLNRAIAAGLEEVGMMVPEDDDLTREALLSAGFRSLGVFDWFRTELPLSSPASALQVEEKRAESSEVVND